MTAEDIALVQESWRKIEPAKEVAAELFYTRLFEIDPPLQEFFGDDLKSHKHRFTQILGATVRGLERVDVLMPAVRALGIRHRVFGSVERHHASIANALLWALEKGLRNDFTADVKSAWIKTYGALSQVMWEASLEPRPA